MTDCLHNDLATPTHIVILPIHVRCHNEGALQCLGEKAKEVHQVILRDAVVRLGGGWLGADNHLHEGVGGLGEGVVHEDLIRLERIDRAVFLPCAVVFEVGAGGKDLVSCVVEGTVRVDHLRDGFVGQLGDVVGGGH